MGADLYITSITNKNQEKYLKLFEDAVEQRNKATTDKEKAKYQKNVSKYYDAMYKEGYFRDSYNGTSLFWTIGLSWWKDVPVDNSGMLSVEETKKLLNTIKAKKIPSLKEITISIQKSGVAVDNKENSPSAWRKYFVDKKKTLEKFLAQAIKINEPIRCSV